MTSFPDKRPREASSELRELAAAANGKKKKTKRELDAIALVDTWASVDNELAELKIPGWLYARIIGSSHFSNAAKQAGRLELDLKDPVDVGEMIRNLHSFLRKYPGDFVRAPVGRPVEHASEKKRLLELQVQEREMKIQKAAGQWIPREKVREGLLIISNSLRDLGDRLARLPNGAEAHELLEETLGDIAEAIREQFDIGG